MGKLTAALCALTVCGILLAGLWPLHAPKNQVRWLQDENGVQFGHSGTILSSGMFELADAGGRSWSFEIWVHPAFAWNTGTVLALYNPVNHERLEIRQNYTNLKLQYESEEWGESKLMEMSVPDVFRREMAFITVASSGRDIAIYVDGRLAARSVQPFQFTPRDLVWQLIVATSPMRNHSWSGQLRGLALYRSELGPSQVAEHFGDWTQKGNPTANGDFDGLVALYLLDEHTGTVIHNQLKPGVDLYIPERYMVVDHIFLEPPWKEFRSQSNYLSGVVINICGFIPLGFILAAFLEPVRQIKHPIVAAIVCGALTSLAIEIFQAYLPTRFSGVSDLATNTLGTVVGALLYRAAGLSLKQRLAARCGNRAKA